jgi:hypothetical protein
MIPGTSFSNRLLILIETIMKKKKTDRHLDVPAEANRDKHINYVAIENQETDPALDNPEGKLDKPEENKKEIRRERDEIF